MVARSSIDVFLRLHGQRKFSKEVAASAAELEAMGLKGARSLASFAAAGDKMKKFGKSWTRNVSLPVTLSAVLAGKAAVDWESAFTGVRKTVSATEAQYASLEKGIRSMALEIPVAANELAGIAEAAGQLGVKRQAILGFTRTIADLGVSTNLAGEEGATTLARFANITQMPQSQFRRLGSTIVALGNAGASTESDIAAMGLRLAAAGNYVGMTEPQILGIANALSSVGIEAEAGGTAMSQAMKLINSAVDTGGKKLTAYARVAGMGGKEFAQAWKQDSAAALTSWIEGLTRLKNNGKDVPALLTNLDKKLGGTRVQDTLLRAAGAGDLFRESLGLGSKAWQENNALSREAGKRYETVASQLQILKNKVIDAGISLGQELLPPMIEFANFAGPAVGAAAEAFGGLPGPIQASALGFLVLTGPVVSGLGYLAGGVGRVLILTSKLAQAATIFKAVMSPNVMTESSGFGAAFGAASKKAGMAGAMQTAKGLALSLGPAVAAAGIGNIVMSATEGDWESAGWSAGGALAGGIAGFMVGGPLGAMIGGGLGSFAGDALKGLFESAPQVSLLRKQMDHLRASTDAYRSSLRRLPNAQENARRASRRHDRAVRDEHRASQALARTLGRFGTETLPATKAQLRLARAQARVVKTAREEKAMHRLSGNALKLFRMDSLKQVASIKQALPTLRRRVKTMNQEITAGRTGRKFLAQTVREERKLQSAKHELVAVYAQAESKAGKPWAQRLENLTGLQAKYGRNGKVLVDRLREQRASLADLGAMASKQPGKWNELRNAIAGTRRELERFGEATDGLSPSRLTPSLPGEGLHHRPSGRRPTRKGGGQNTFAIPAPKTNRLPRGSFDGAVTLEVINHNRLDLDGKVAAESTTRQAQRRANRK